MSVELDPVELGFQRPFTSEVSQTLRLRNPHNGPVAFKVKTTAPKQYCVRPNSGRIEVGGTVEVQVLLQAMKEDPPVSEKCRDKFLVQSVVISADKEFANVAEAIEKSSKSSISEKKIRVTWLPADGSAVPAAVSTPAKQSAAHEEVPPAYSSPVSAVGTPAAPIGAVSRPESKPADSKSTAEAKATATSGGYVAAAGGAVAGAAATVAAVVPSNTEELKAQLEDAKATIARLTQQAAEQTGLRQRKVESSDSKPTSASSAPVALQQAPGGVPVPIVAILCLLSFLLAYLLF